MKVFNSVYTISSCWIFNFQKSRDGPLINEIGTQYDSVSHALMQFLESAGSNTFPNLTQSIFPCKEAHRAVQVALSVTCGEKGGINRLTGMIYVFALTVLFIAIFYFCLFAFAFVQTLQISRLASINDMEPSVTSSLYKGSNHGSGNTFGDFGQYP